MADEKKKSTKANDEESVELEESEVVEEPVAEVEPDVEPASVDEPAAAEEPAVPEPVAAAEEPAAEEAATTEEPVTGESVVEESPAEEAVAEAAAVAGEPAADEEAVAAEEPTEAEGEPEADAAVEPAPDAAAAPAEAAPKRSRKRLPRALRHKHSKPKREPAKTRKPITRTPKPEGELGRRQERRGVVVSDKGDKTIVVRVSVTRAHPRYKKVVRRSRKFHAHDETNSAAIGDTVRIVETRPLSKTKHWRLAEIVERAR
jgi:small subunit ribosomal protein S17